MCLRHTIYFVWPNIIWQENLACIIGPCMCVKIILLYVTYMTFWVIHVHGPMIHYKVFFAQPTIFKIFKALPVWTVIAWPHADCKSDWITIGMGWVSLRWKRGEKIINVCKNIIIIIINVHQVTNNPGDFMHKSFHSVLFCASSFRSSDPGFFLHCSLAHGSILHVVFLFFAHLLFWQALGSFQFPLYFSSHVRSRSFFVSELVP